MIALVLLLQPMPIIAKRGITELFWFEKSVGDLLPIIAGKSSTQASQLSRMLLLWVVLLLAGLCVRAGQSPRSHIILLVADDLGWNDVSFHGSNQIPTPNLDKLAYDGIILNNYYVSPICTPTRSAIMTGRHPIHTGMQYSVIVGPQPYGLPLNETIMPQYLNKLGYRSHMIGKWHLGFFANEYTPLYRGFESHYGYYLGCEDYFDHSSEANLNYWGWDWRRGQDILLNETGQYSTDLFTKEAVKVITNHDPSEPLFLFLPYQAVHSGNQYDALQAPQHYVDRFPHIKNIQRRLFAGMVSAMDDSVGTVISTLKQKGMYDNAIIAFTTDNGGPSNGFDWNAASNWPLRGVKDTIWEGGVRGVGFLHSPLLKQRNYVAEQMMHVCDWLPTFLKAAGGDPSLLVDSDGMDMWEMLSHNGKAIRSELLHNIDPKRKFAGIRIGDYKLLFGDIRPTWSDWYPPWQLKQDSNLLHINKTGGIKYKAALKENEEAIGQFFEEDGTCLNRKNSTNSKCPQNRAVKVKCGKKPLNASINCQPLKKLCLFHIPSDPCEYNNIADQHPDIVSMMLDRLAQYNSTMVAPGNKPFDPEADPKKHDNCWVPWIKLNKTEE
ncbi:hypothetical protein ScPMuIL_011752 [Solemya velum]